VPPVLPQEAPPDIVPEPEIPWWASRAAKIIYACVGAIVLVAALWYVVRSIQKKRAQKTTFVEDTVLEPTFTPPQPVQPQPVRNVRAEPAQITQLPAKVEIKLTTVSPTDAKQYVVKIVDKIEIGRGEQCQVRFPDDASVSSRHCEISWNAGELYLRDLGSTNGVSVNGVPIRGSYNLKLRDVIELGKIRLRLGEVKTL
jgi:hypothetical protein